MRIDIKIPGRLSIKSIYIEKNNLLLRFRGGLMDIKHIALAGVMTLSSIVLTYKWLTRLGNLDPVIIISAMLLIGSLGVMIILIDQRLRGIEETLDAKERSIRINIKGVEEHLDQKMDTFVKSTSNTIGEFSKRMYR
jgi:hypothetical protein